MNATARPTSLVLFTNRDAGSRSWTSPTGALRPALIEFWAWLQPTLQGAQSLADCQPRQEWQDAWQEWVQQLPGGTDAERFTFLSQLEIRAGQGELVELQATLLTNLIGLRYFCFQPITPESAIIAPDADSRVRHAQKIAIALAEWGGGEARTYGSIPNDLHALEKVFAKLRKAHPGAELRVYYEAAAVTTWHYFPDTDRGSGPGQPGRQGGGPDPESAAVEARKRSLEMRLSRLHFGVSLRWLCLSSDVRRPYDAHCICAFILEPYLVRQTSCLTRRGGHCVSLRRLGSRIFSHCRSVSSRQ